MSPVPDHATVIASDGLTGIIETEASNPANSEQDLEVLVTFSDGRRLWVPAEALILQSDGQFRLDVPLAELTSSVSRPTIHSRSRELEERLAELNLAATQPVSQVGATGEQGDAEPDDQPGQEGSAAGVLSEAELAGPDQISTEPEPRAKPQVRVSKVVQAHREEIGASLLREEVVVQRIPINEYVDAPPEIRYEADSIIIPVLEEVLVVTKRLLLKEEVVVTRRRAQVNKQQPEVRQTEDVFVTPFPAPAANEYNSSGAANGYDAHYRQFLAETGHSFEYFQAAYTYGQALRAKARPGESVSTWEQLEPEARRTWEAHNPGTWNTVCAAVRFAWGA